MLYFGRQTGLDQRLALQDFILHIGHHILAPWLRQSKHVVRALQYFPEGFQIRQVGLGEFQLAVFLLRARESRQLVQARLVLQGLVDPATLGPSN